MRLPLGAHPSAASLRGDPQPAGNDLLCSGLSVGGLFTLLTMWVCDAAMQNLGVGSDATAGSAAGPSVGGADFKAALKVGAARCQRASMRSRWAPPACLLEHTLLGGAYTFSVVFAHRSGLVVTECMVLHMIHAIHTQG